MYLKKKKTARSPARRGNASAAPRCSRSLPRELRDAGSPFSRRRAPGSPLHPASRTDSRSICRCTNLRRAATAPGARHLPVPHDARHGCGVRSGSRPAALDCEAARKEAIPHPQLSRSRSLGGRTAAARPERRSQPASRASPLCRWPATGRRGAGGASAAPGPRVTHRLKCSMIFSSRTFSGKFPTQRCLVSRTMLGGVPATAVAGSPSPASYAAVSAGRRAPGRRRRRLRRWRRRRRRRR